MQGAARWVPVPFPRLVRGSLSRGNAVASGTEAACRVEEAVFLGAMLKGEPCPWMLLRQASGRRGRCSGSSLTHVKPCHPVLPIMGSGCSCHAGDTGRDIPGWLRPVAPALPPLVALWLWVHPTGCARRRRVLRVQPRTPGLGHTPWPGTVGHGPPSPGG